MITLGLCFVAYIVILIVFVFKDPWNGLVDKIFISIIALLITLLTGILLNILISCLFPPELVSKIIDTKKIEVLQDNSSVSGKFVLGTGTIEGKIVYSYYYKIDINDTNKLESVYYTFKLESVYSDKAVINYSDGEPKIETYKYQLGKKRFIDYFSEIGAGFQAENLGYHYIIYVPKGSIRNSYTLDAQ